MRIRCFFGICPVFWGGVLYAIASYMHNSTVFQTESVNTRLCFVHHEYYNMTYCIIYVYVVLVASNKL